MVKRVEAELKIEVRSLINAANITASMMPFTPGGIRRITCDKGEAEARKEI